MIVLLKQSSIPFQVFKYSVNNSFPPKFIRNINTKMRGISADQVIEFRKSFAGDPNAKVAQNAAALNLIKDVCANRDILQTTEMSAFSTQLDEWSVTNQKSSGRCWLFALLNLFRVGAMKKLNVKDFEFSQAHIHFWDKFERCNHFMEAMIELSDRPVDDRTTSWLLNDPIGDGGQFSMAINIINKHGLVPKAAFPESFSSSATLGMNTILKDLLRSTACELRALKDSGGGAAALAELKDRRMQDVWRILCIHLGTPPESFEWQWTDKDKKYTNKGTMTPLEFAAEYVEVPYNDYVCLVNDPRNPYMKTYTVDYLQSVADGARVLYLNVDTDTMKTLTNRQLLDGLPVWMGCDVGKQFDRKVGIWDLNAFEFENFYKGKNYQDAMYTSVLSNILKLSKSYPNFD